MQNPPNWLIGKKLSFDSILKFCETRLNYRRVAAFVNYNLEGRLT
jgi:hypothetical protein